METVKTYTVKIRVTRAGRHYGAAAETAGGGLLESLPPLSAHENDAVYALLHALALKNNFCGCLGDAEDCV